MRSVPSSFLPSVSVGAKLFVTGMTVGPLVDSLHNQCLLEYDFLPLALNLVPESDSAPILCSSWIVPPLLGIAYVVLGGILPRWIQFGFQWIADSVPSRHEDVPEQQQQQQIFKPMFPWNRAVLASVAVLTTAGIIKCSELLEVYSGLDTTIKYNILFSMALFQWLTLDGSLVSLIAASITSVGGPLSELPFVAHHAWHYLPLASDYQPLQNMSQDYNWFWEIILGKDYKNLALSTITGPCYFAVTMDAIALGKWFDNDDVNY
jgi:hypothetical protein